MKSPFVVPKYLIPAKKYQKKWPVIACDQYSSNPYYWEKIKARLELSPSSINLIIPEALYSSLSDWSDYIETINRTALDYLENRVLNEFDEGVILVKRITSSGERFGLLLLLDLEKYDYIETSIPIVKSTEYTDQERLLKRTLLRSSLDIELTHTLIFFDDINDELIKPYRSNPNLNSLLYKVDLESKSGQVEGRVIKDKEKVLDYFDSITKNEGSSFFVADGNHSLAAAKRHWDSKKNDLVEEEIYHHPLRYYMVELINLHDQAVVFHPIHRIIYPVKNELLNKILELNLGTYETKIFMNGKPYHIYLTNDLVQNYIYIDQLILDESIDKKIHYDFVHGESEAIHLSKYIPNCIAIIMPTLKKEFFFEMLKSHRILPKKSFSIGHAYEKRFYIEGRKVK